MQTGSNDREHHSEFIINPCEDPEYRKRLENVLKAQAVLTAAISALYSYNSVIKISFDCTNDFSND